MKKLLSIVHSLSFRSLMLLTITTSMVILLFLGPIMLKTSSKISLASSDKTTNPISSVAATTGIRSMNNATTDSTPSVFSTSPITLPDGSTLKVSPLTTTPSTSGSNSSSGTTASGPDPAVCTSAQAAISQIQNAYAAQNQPLQVEINNYRDIITNNGKNYAARGSGPTPDEQAYDQKVLVALQNDQNHLSYNLQQMNSQLVSYQQQVIANCH